MIVILRHKLTKEPYLIGQLPDGKTVADVQKVIRNGRAVIEEYSEETVLAEYVESDVAGTGEAIQEDGQGLPPVVREEENPSPDSSPQSGEGSEIEMTDSARAVIEERDLDPRLIDGTGAGGRITKPDVDKYLAGLED